MKKNDYKKDKLRLKFMTVIHNTLSIIFGTFLVLTVIVKYLFSKKYRNSIKR